jgi:HEAT repeat protein
MDKIDNLISSLDGSNAENSFQNLIDIGKPAVKPLIKSLTSKSPNVRNAAAQILGHIGDEEAVDPVIHLLKDSNEQVPQGAAHALGMIGDARGVKPLIDALSHDNLMVREPAALALGRIGDKRATKPLINAIREGLPWKKSQKPAAATDFDWQVWTMKTEHSMRSQAAGALIDIGSDAANELITNLEDESTYVRGFAASCLGQIGESQAIDSLVDLLEDDDQKVRDAASGALKLLGWKTK